MDSDDEELAKGRSGGDEDDGVVEVAGLESGDEGRVRRKSKKRRMSLAQEKDDEEAFWLGGTSSGDAEGAASSSTAAATNEGDEEDAEKDKSDSKASARGAKTKKGPLLYRRLTASASTSEAGLLSPPASHRKPQVSVAPVAASAGPSSPESLPATPQAKSKKKGTPPRAALKDSPGNPFLETPDDGTSASAKSLSPVREETEPVYEKPFVTYVFRGVRRTYQNPMYDHARNRAITPPPNSKLPVEDPLYSPDPTLRPRLLFPEAHKKRVTRSSTKKAAAPLLIREDSDSEDGFGPIAPLNLGAKGKGKGAAAKIKAPNFGSAETKTRKTKPVTLDTELRKAVGTATTDGDVFS